MAGMPWLRLYAEMIDDPKIGRLSDAEFRLWIEILCLACKGEDGNTKHTDKDLDWSLRRNVTSALQALYETGLIGYDDDDYVVVANWEKRQHKSDSSADRVRKYRENKKKKECNADVTLQQRNDNATDTDTDTDTDKSKDLSPLAEVTPDPFASFESFWNCYPRKTSKAAAEKSWKKLKPSEETLFLITSNINARLAVGDWELDRKDYIPHPSTYLNGKRWEDEVIAKENSNEANRTASPKLSDAERVRAKIEQRRAERATASILPRQH